MQESENNEFTASSLEAPLYEDYCGIIDIFISVYNSYADLTTGNCLSIPMRLPATDSYITRKDMVMIIKENLRHDCEFYIRFDPDEAFVVRSDDAEIVNGEIYVSGNERIDIVLIHEVMNEMEGPIKIEHGEESVNEEGRAEAGSIETSYMTEDKESIKKVYKRTVVRRNPFIGDMAESVRKWRKLKETYGTYEKAAKIIGIPKKTLDDYLTQITKGEKYRFPFKELQHKRIGVLRKFIMAHEERQKKNKQEENKQKRRQIFKIINWEEFIQ